MADDVEERRQQDQRDLEFYSKRVKPSASDLLRTNRLSQKNNKISLDLNSSSERNLIHPPGSLGEILTDDRYPRDQPETEDTASSPSETDRSEAVWPLVAAAIVLILLGSSGKVDRMMAALAF